MFYETFGWWGLLTLSIIAGFFQQIGFYGRGRGSQKIEIIANLLMFATFVASFFISGIFGGISLIILLVIINSSITKYLVRVLFRKVFDYLSAEREAMQAKVLEEAIIHNSQEGNEKMGVLEIDREVRSRLNIND